MRLRNFATACITRPSAAGQQHRAALTSSKIIIIHRASDAAFVERSRLAFFVLSISVLFFLARAGMQDALILLDQVILDIGFVGVLIGTVGVLQAMDNPKVVGPAIAVACLTLLYALGIKLLVGVSIAESSLLSNVFSRSFFSSGRHLRVQELSWTSSRRLPTP